MIEFSSDIQVECVDHMGGDWSVIAAAKVSVDPLDARRIMEEKEDDGRGLINYLMKNRHGSPFEHSCMTFFVDAPIFVWREWHRHRIGMSYNEESGRWSELRGKFYIPGRDRAMLNSKDYKPSKPILEPMPEDQYEDWVLDQKTIYAACYLQYQKSLGLGVCKEVARMILPVGIYSRCWVTCNPRSLMHFLSLRTHRPEARYVSHPQREIAIAAEACELILARYWPLCWEAFCNNGRVAP